MTPKPPVLLVVQPQRRETRSLVEQLNGNGFEAVAAADAEAADNVLSQRPVRCLVCELRGRRIDGLALLRRALKRNPSLCAVLVADPADADAAEAALREGAYDVLPRPVPLARLLAVLRRGLEHQALAARVTRMAQQLDEHLGLEGLTGSSGALHRVMEQVRAVAPTRANVLIEGEPGSGRRLVAQHIHRGSPRRDEAFVWVDCAAAGEGVLEGDLFGYEGSATGAAVVRVGRLELADGGTLFLGEVGEAPARVQARLLRAIQERAFERVGGAQSLHADVRFIASTSRDLDAAARAGRFRSDLLKRLSVVRIRMPSLKQRREDLPLLVNGFIRDAARRHGRRVTGITPGALDALLGHAWPGNVRELKNVVEGMVVAVSESRRLDLSDLPRPLRGRSARGAALEVSVGMTMGEVEHRLIEATLRQTGGDKRRAAAILGIGLRTLYRKIKEYGLGS